MPELKYEKITVRSVEYQEWDAFIQEVYGVKEYSVVADEEWNNDSDHVFYTSKEELDDYDLEQLEKFKNGEHVGCMTYTLMADLCNRRLLGEATYLINVCW